MPNILQLLARVSLNRGARLAAAAALLAFAPAAVARQLDFRGTKIEVEGVDEGNYAYVKGDPNSGSEELILVWTNCAPGAINKLVVPYNIEAQMFLVGGGGAGGYGTTGTTNPGGGGGGGEALEVENDSYGAGTYAITVGIGGMRTTTTKTNGENGHPSSITFDGLVVTNALGGGGGGSQKAGNGGTDVATGGGGGGKDNAGGVGTLGENHKGGAAPNKTNRSGGGGGAGGKGDDAGDTGGKGGAGTNSVIFADVGADELKAIPRRFGGGGGGGQSVDREASGAGSATDGGGHGGYRDTHGEGGKLATGGGGGGGGRGSSGYYGGAGGSGVVIIRITYIELPMRWVEIPVSAGGHDGKIFVDENAATNWVNGDLVITYTNTARRGGLRFFNPDDPSLPPIWAQANVLLVGGGGGGGFINARETGTDAGGAGGGGGAGGFVPLVDLTFDSNLEFSIEVGKGGAGGDVNKTPGVDGGSSFVLTNNNMLAEAYGGGVGGAYGEGSGTTVDKKIGSGGGGSYIKGGKDGGLGYVDQGKDGGAGSNIYGGGGGGGAGGEGKDFVSASGGGGAGGEGRKSAISGEERWYAGGGGGAYLNTASSSYVGGDGGSGVGGNGAGAPGGVAQAAGNGMDGRGGGGGGGASHENATSPAGKGGSGVVIIRLSNFVVQNIPVPPSGRVFEYDGKEHVGVDPFFAYSVVTNRPGDRTEWARGVDAENYVVTVTIPEEAPYEWSDGGKGDRRVTWKITQLKVDVPTWNTDNPPRPDYFVFGNTARNDEEEKCAIDGNKWRLRTDRPGYPGETCATTNKWGEELTYCTLTGHRETNAGAYHFTAALVKLADGYGRDVTNFVWRSGMGDAAVAWTIETAENAITALALASWQEGTAAKKPTSDWQWRKTMEKYPDHYPTKDVVTYRWRPEGGGWDDARKPVEELVMPTEAGVYELEAYICKDSNHTEDYQYGNWEEKSRRIRFFVWRHPSKTLSDYVDIQPTGCGITASTSALTDFPVLVRLREPVRDATGAITNGLPGFRYADVRRNGLDLRFISVSNETAVAEADKDNPLAKDTLLPFEVDTWDPNGESLVWVKIPKLYKTAKFRMYWRLRDGAELYDDIEPREVWANGYVGVWHFNETISAADAATAHSADSSGNGRDAVPAGGANANLATMTSVPGMIGNARQNETRSTKAGNSLRLAGTEGFDFAGKVTMSTWIKINGYSNSTYPRVFSSKLLYTGNYGFEMELGPQNNNGTFRAAGTATMSSKQIFNKANTSAGWANVTFKINGSGSNNCKYYSYLPGYPTGYNGTGNLGALQPSPDAIFLGNDPGSTDPSAQQPSIWGYYDETRLSNVVRSDDWVKAEFESVNNALYCTFGLVNQLQGTSGGVDDRAWVNWWSAEPWTTLSKTPGTEGGRYWRQPPNEPSLDPPTLATNDFGKLARVYTTTSSTAASKTIGTVVATYVKMPSGEIEPLFPTELGPYVIELTMSGMEAGTDDYPGRHVLYDGVRKVDIEIVEDKPSPIVPGGEGGSDAVNLRVLLANDDVEGRNAGNAVSNQSYWVWRHDDRVAPPKVLTNETATGFAVLTNNLLMGSSHVLTNAQGTALWTLESVYLGNMMTANPDPAAAPVLDGQHSLPWSATSRNSSPDPSTYGEPLDRRWVGQMALQNICTEPDDLKDDVTVGLIRSPWYTNGVGTVYFDAVNAFAADAAAFKLQVEFSTNAIDNATASQRSNFVWRCARAIRLKYDGSAFTSPVTNEQVTLDIADGDGLNRFYRVIAPVPPEYRRAPCRFRIRRVSMLDEYAGETDDWHGFIVLDNVIASWPTTAADLESCGWYDPRKSGKEVLGWETAFEKDFPCAAETELYGRAAFAGDSAAITSARCHYRWRYLDAQFSPARTLVDDRYADVFTVLYLDPAAGFRSASPFKLPGIAGDLEYWFDLTACVPFYGYCDYSGLGTKEPTGGYTENPEKGVTSRRPADDGMLPSRGTDWFVRLREGESGVESFKAHFTYTLRDEYEVETQGRQEVGLFLVENHLWRGYLKTSKEMAGRPAKYRLEMRTPTEPGARAPRLMTSYLVAADALVKPEDVPGSTMLRTVATSNETEEVFIDSATGALMLQLDDRSMSLTLSHADYQDFNGWSDAVSDEDPPLFTGSSIEGPKKKGSSSKSVRLSEAFDGWGDTPETKDWWQEPFGGTIDDGTHAGWAPFDTAPTPNQWTANNGQWVARYYHPRDATSRGQSGLAVELFGAQNGNVQILSPAGNPRGLGKVSYAARVAQTTDFYDFCYTEAEKPSHLTNYTFITRAAFDLNKNKNFAGNASLSLVAFYRSKEGCYEVRWEQLNGVYDTNKKVFTGPARDSQRLCLYRWAPGDSGEIEPELLGAVTNNVNVNYYWNNSKGARTAYNVNVTGNYRVKQPEASGFGSADYFLPIYISARALKGGVTEVAAGVYSCGNNSYNNEKGGLLASDPESKYAQRNWVSLFYRDTSKKRLSSGAYGLLSANCEAVFLQPAKRSEMSVPNTSNFNYATNQFCACANTAMKFNGTYEECREDLAWGDWSILDSRMHDFDEGAEKPGVWGVEALVPSTTLNLLLCPKGGDAWTVAGTRTVTGFGTYERAGEPNEFLVREVYDRSIRLAAGSSAMTDVVLTRAEFTQWRGDNFGDPNGDTTAWAGVSSSDYAYGMPGKIVFTTGLVVTNETKGFAHKVRLSARRAPAGKPVSLRSPYFDGREDRGEGLGMIAFTYENAQTNADVLVQIATNNLQASQVADATQSVDPSYWTTVARFDFSQSNPAERRRGVRTVYLGLHGVKGLMRVVLNPDLVANVQSNRVSDTTAFGEIDITKFVCRDEPNLEAADWWGWNVRTVASVTNGVGDVLRTYLPDGDVDAEASGMPIALNCSVTEDTLEEDVEDLKNHMPFVQTPTFTNNIVGEISFKARRYDNGESSQYAEVQLYGGYSGREGDDREWVPLKQFIVSNTTYEAYSFRGAGTYSAFRLAVTGVKDVKYPGEKRAYDPAVRVLIDEVAVFEAVNPEMGFVYVYPFRDGIDRTAACTNVVDAQGTALPGAQPLCGESWTVQAMIQKTKLPDEIDMTDHPPRVLFHWYFGNYPWGYSKWRGERGAKTAELALADGETMVFRGSIPKARAAVVEATMDAPTVVQYSADVIYRTVAGLELTNSLVRNAATTWVRPSWYAPVDYNAGKAQASAYTILDTIAPGRVWINEVNLWDGRNPTTFVGYAETNQYIEVAAPELQSLEGWRLEYISNDKTVNTLVRFTSSDTGDGYAPPTKDLKKIPAAKLNEYRTNDYVFLAVQSPKSRDNRAWASVPGAIDGVWRNFNGIGGDLDQMKPVAIRLIRPSQIVEHEVVLEGTNTWLGGRHEGRDSPTNWIAQVERGVLGAKSSLFYAGSEDPNTDRQSIGVVRNTGAVSNDWKNLMVQTPGRVNEGQIVPYGYVLYANGEFMIVRARLAETGHILQTLADETNTASEVTLMIKKGGAGTNITYTVADWWETAFVTTNGQMIAEATGKRGTYTVNVGAGQSNDVTVVAMAQPMTDLREKYGLTEDNPYTPAVMDWLEGKKNFFGEEFEHPGEIHLAEFRTPVNGLYITNLDLTAMYWLDIDPTVSNTWLKGGIVNSRHGGIHPIILDDPPPAVTNFRMGVHMEITNLLSGVAYAPYVLRGLAPGQTSADYEGNWDSVTFKITGDIQISDPAYAGRERWIPLRWFVFKPKPGATSRVGASASFGDDFRSTVDVWDPKDESAAIYTQGWSAFPDAPVFYRWALDGRNAPVEIEALRPESTYSE